MVIKEGYKQTEIGVIPNDWEVKNIGDVCQIFGRIGFRGYTVNDIVKKEQGAITISPSNIYGDKINFAKCTYISWFKYHESPEIKIYNGDVLLVKTGSTSGKTALVKNLNEKATINPQLVVLKKILINNFLLSYIMSYDIVQNQIISTIVGGAIPTLSQKQVLSFKIPLAPSLTEQTAIANALSDADGLIASLEKLIAKKRNIKQGAMQQLLQPKEGWEVKKFNDVFKKHPAKAYQINSFEYEESGVFPIIDQGKKLIVGYSDNKDKVFNCPVGGVIIFGDHTRILKYINFNFIVGADGTQLISTQKGNYCLFIYYLLLTKEIPNTGYNRHFKFLLEMEFSIPTFNEQTRIASILSDMDEELSALEQKLEKYKKVKLGMMQELLTGKTRLI